MTASPTARPPRPALAGTPFAIRPEMLASAEPVLCEVCENDLFLETVIIRKLSALLSPSGRTEMMRFPVLACSQCGHVNAGFLPPGVHRESPGPMGDAGEDRGSRIEDRGADSELIPPCPGTDTRLVKGDDGSLKWVGVPLGEADGEPGPPGANGPDDSGLSLDPES